MSTFGYDLNSTEQGGVKFCINDTTTFVVFTKMKSTLSKF